MWQTLKTLIGNLSNIGRLVALSGILAVSGSTYAVASQCHDTTLYHEGSATQTIPYAVNRIKDPDLMVPDTKIKTAGVDGEKSITYKIGTRCNKEVSRVEIPEKTSVIKQPATEDLLYGIKTIEIVYETQTIPYEFQQRSNPNMDSGQSKITQKGINGTKRVTYSVIKIEGVEQSRSVSKEEIIVSPTPQITEIGTRIQSQCDPNYTGCVPNVYPSDVDCAGGSGNGPYYASGPLRVIGVDRYGLDRDGDGWACE